MVHHSDLAYRLQTRRHGAQLVYTEMFPAAVFASSKNYRSHVWKTCDEDRPLVVQVSVVVPAR
jgi:tRNA-dihydrouridine synthase 1